MINRGDIADKITTRQVRYIIHLHYACIIIMSMFMHECLCVSMSARVCVRACMCKCTHFSQDVTVDDTDSLVPPDSTPHDQSGV